MRMILGVDVGGTKIAAGLVSSTGKVSRFVTRPTEGDHDGKYVLATIRKMIAGRVDRSVTAIGVGIAGQVDHERGVLRSSPNLPAGFKNLALAKLLQRDFRLPVVIENDARCFALAEATYGAGKKYNHVVGITLGTGVGGGMVKNRALVRGADNTAGEIGHTTVNLRGASCGCGQHGHLEAHASVSGMARQYRTLTQRTIDAHKIEALFRRGDKHALRIIKGGAHALAVGLTNVLTCANPDCVVLGGGLANFRAYINLALREIPKLVPFPHLAKTPIIFSKLGGHAGIIGAALLTKNHNLQAPSTK